MSSICKNNALLRIHLRNLFSTEAVRKMSIDRRKCVKHDENLNETNVRLDVFKDYSTAGCLLECRAR